MASAVSVQSESGDRERVRARLRGEKRGAVHGTQSHNCLLFNNLIGIVSIRTAAIQPDLVCGAKQYAGRKH